MQKAMKASFKPFNASDWKVGIVVAHFNKHITEELLKGAITRAKDYKIDEKNIDVMTVAGSVELPVALQAMAEKSEYAALLGIGCVIRGETPHFDYVCKMACEGILRVSLDYKIPVGLGVLTCENEKQAKERAHLGGEHLDAALQLAKEIRDLGEGTTVPKITHG